MRLIDADRIKFTKYINGDITVSKQAIQNMPTAYDVDKVIERLQMELSLADGGKERCARENPFQFDTAKGYAHGISVALEIVKSGGVADE